MHLKFFIELIKMKRYLELSANLSPLLSPKTKIFFEGTIIIEIIKKKTNLITFNIDRHLP